MRSCYTTYRSAADSTARTRLPGAQLWPVVLCFGSLASGHLASVVETLGCRANVVFLASLIKQHPCVHAIPITGPKDISSLVSMVAARARRAMFHVV